MKSKLLYGVALASLFASTGTAIAQNSGDEIVVTGSRVSRSTFSSPTPLTVIGADQIAKMGQVNIAEAIKTLPQNIAANSETAVGLNGATSAYSVGAQIGNLRGLNPTSGGAGVRTLTMVDTKRFVPSTPGGAVDMNLIPSMLVQRVETVTGGASAAYGTDALAGVINVILDKKLTGFKAQLDGGQTFQGDGDSVHASFAGGFGWNGDKAHTIFGVEYQNDAKVGDCTYARDWCRKGYDTWINEANATNGQARFIRGEGGAYTNYNLTNVLRGSTQGTRVNPVAIRNLTFSADGRRVVDFDPGNYVQAIGFNDRQGGTCALDCSPWSEVQLKPDIKRGTFFTHTDFDLTDHLRAHVEGNWGFRKTHIKGLSLGPNSTTVYFPDNPFLAGVTYLDRATGTTKLLTDLLTANAAGNLPATSGQSPTGLAGIAWAPGVPTLALFNAKHFRNVPGGRSDSVTDMKSYRVEGGLEGDFHLVKDWKWDAYYQYGKTEQDVAISGLRVNSFFTYAIDAVIDPATGKPTCRALLPGPANTFTPPGTFQRYNDPNAAGCVPLNMSGANTEDPAAVAYAYRTTKENFQYEQHVVAGNLRGDIYEGWAGPISAAIGGEYRYETGDTKHNKLPFNGEFSTVAFGADFGGDLKILEGYVEMSAPLLKDAGPFFKSVEFDAAYRATKQTNTDHSTNQSKDLSVDTFKLSGTWDVNDWLRFRGTRSQDIRAAGFNDLYYSQNLIPPGPPSGTALNRWNANVNDSTSVTWPANFKLNPERGWTNTAGIVLKAPEGILDGLRFSADYYDIKIQDAISILTTQEVVDACFNANVGCENLFTGVAGAGTPFSSLSAAQRTDINTVARGSRNVGKFRTNGWDFEMEYRTPLSRVSNLLTGDLTVRTIATKVNQFLVNLGNGSGNIEYVNQTGGSAFGGFTAPPKYTINTFTTYNVGGFSATVDTKYIPKGIYDIRRLAGAPNTNANSINDNSVDSKFYVGVSTSYKFAEKDTRSAEVFFSIRNLFNVTPPNAASEAGGTGGRVTGVGGPTNPVFYDTLGAQWRSGLRLAF